MSEYFTRGISGYVAPSNVILTVAAPHDRVVDATITDVDGNESKIILSNGSKVALKKGEKITGQFAPDSNALGGGSVAFSAIGDVDGSANPFLTLPDGALGPGAKMTLFNPPVSVAVPIYDSDGNLSVPSGSVGVDVDTAEEYIDFINSSNQYWGGAILSIAESEYLDTIKQIVTTRNFQYAITTTGKLLQRTLASPFLSDQTEESYYNDNPAREPSPDEYELPSQSFWVAVSMQIKVDAICRMPRWNGETDSTVYTPGTPPGNFNIQSPDGIIFATNFDGGVILGAIDGQGGIVYKSCRASATVGVNGREFAYGYGYPRLPVILDANGDADYSHYTQGGTSATNGLNPSEIGSVEGRKIMFGDLLKHMNVVKILPLYRGLYGHVSEGVWLIFDDGSISYVSGFMTIDFSMNPDYYYLWQSSVAPTASERTPSLSHLFLDSSFVYMPLILQISGKRHLDKLIGYEDLQSAIEIFHNNSNLQRFLNKGEMLPEGTPAQQITSGTVFFRYWQGNDLGWAETQYKNRTANDIHQLIGFEYGSYIYLPDPESTVVENFPVLLEVLDATLYTVNGTSVFPVVVGWMPSNGHPFIWTPIINNGKLLSMAWVFGLGDNSKLVGVEYESRSIELDPVGNPGVFTLQYFLIVTSFDGRSFEFNMDEDWF